MRNRQAVRDVYDDDGSPITLPTRKELCPRCHGEGTHVNSSIDGNGITSEEMHELGDDFREDYLHGVYDVRCEECNGDNVIDVVDEDRCPPSVLALYNEELREEAEYQAMCAAERAMGA